jgi:phosphatidylethanolamine-binding protein (PEBP) family uncharacterized protein
LYALDKRLDFKIIPTKAHLEEAMIGHLLQKIELMGTYQHGDP